MENTANGKPAGPTHPCFRGVPTYIRALIYDVATRKPGYDYSIVGRELARHTADMIADAYDVEDPEQRIGQLWEFINATDKRAIIEWYRWNFPAIMALVSTRRQEKFVYGLLQAVDEGLLS